MSNCKLIFPIFFFFSLHVYSQDGADLIRLNQVGFYPGAPKKAVITGDITATTFFIISADHRDTVYKGTLGEPKISLYSNTITHIAEFTSLKKAGRYIITVPGVGSSYVFRIGNDILKEVGIASLKGFYFQRVSVPLEAPYSGKWNRPAGHTDDKVLIHSSAASEKRPEGTVISSPGGWYDAGDYNKYVVNSGITMGTLLSAYEDFPGYYSTLKTNIPESKDAVPDILNEVAYNLLWMLTMQDPNDGGVYHKCTNAVFDGMVKPGITKAPRYVVKKSTAATLDFAAVTAQATRVFSAFKHQFPNLSQQCLRASKSAWQWALLHPDVVYDQNEINKKFTPEVLTGAYGDRRLQDEWLWAATELFISTRDSSYYTTLSERFKDPVQLPSWSNVAMLGYYSLIREHKKLPVNQQQLSITAKDTVLKMADRFLEKQKLNAFNTVMGQSARDFNWGGNSVAANQAILLIQAYMLTRSRKYLDGALSNIDYILGRNATGYSFITGIGSKSPMHPHHRPSESDGIEDPVPGLLVGGPNIGMQDHCEYPLKEIETAYVDSMCAYACNEIAINWNAPAVYLANALEALKQKANYIQNK
ncbi:MAG: glycoside hydrolase family 9 protein [Candidatus Dadabacteria bacterium]